MKIMIRIFLCLVLTHTLISCGEEAVKMPKPRMFPKVDYPIASEALKFDTTFCNFTFQYPGFGIIVQDSFFYEDNPLHPCWFDINIPDLNASLHCSYYKVTKEKNLSSLINDAFNIVGKHNIKANFRKESIIENSKGAKGIMFDIEGPVASPLQFYLTDEKNHFFRASLYFNSKVNPDSTAPVLKFLKPEIASMIATFEWK
jgi:gliding motility-associated lipoprotein GldD